MLVKGVGSLEIIERYPQDKYLPSILVRGEAGGTVFHAHIATDVDGGNYPRGHDVSPRCE